MQEEEALRKLDAGLLLSSNKSIALKPASSSSLLIPVGWTWDDNTRVLMGKFDPSTPDDPHKLSVALSNKDVAVVTEGFVELDAPTLGTEFVKLFKEDQLLCLICFESLVEDGQVVTVEKPGRMYLLGSEYLGYLEKRKIILNYAKSIEAAIAVADIIAEFQPPSKKVPPIHVGKTALYLTDCELGYTDSLKDRLKLHGPMKYIFPSREWCMTESVSVIACFCEYFCSAMLTFSFAAGGQ